MRQSDLDPAAAQSAADRDDRTNDLIDRVRLLLEQERVSDALELLGMNTSGPGPPLLTGLRLSGERAQNGKRTASRPNRSDTKALAALLFSLQSRLNL